MRAIAITVVVLLIGAFWALAQPDDVEVVVTIRNRHVGPLSGQVEAQQIRTGSGVAEEPIPANAAATGIVKAAGEVSFGRGYGSLTTSPPPFSQLVVRRGAVMWFCIGPNPDGPRPCPAGPKFQTLADAVIRPKSGDCFFFACNAASDCVPAVALSAGELGNVPSTHRAEEPGTGFGTDARADDGNQVFVSWCGTTTVGTGAPTERARSAANDNLVMDETRGLLFGPYVGVREAKEEITFEPSSDYPPARVRVMLRVREGGVHRSDLDAHARRAIRAEAGTGWEVVRGTIRLETTAKPDDFAVGYRVRATVAVDKAYAGQRIASAIANLSPTAARARVRTLFPAAAVQVKAPPNEPLPDADGLDVVIRD